MRNAEELNRKCLKLERRLPDSQGIQVGTDRELATCKVDPQNVMLFLARSHRCFLASAGRKYDPLKSHEEMIARS